VRRACSRQIDTVARLGGEEFAILLPETSMEDAQIAAERVRKAAHEAPVRTESGQEYATCYMVSIGVAEWPEGNELEDKLIFLADEALYRAKSEGRNRVVAQAAGN
jgi:two-component system, cell cycle response regulator